jgi:hypothetical protein
MAMVIGELLEQLAGHAAGNATGTNTAHSDEHDRDQRARHLLDAAVGRLARRQPSWP